jgi:alpha-L-fucosidase
VLLTTGQELAFEQSEDHLVIQGLPLERPSALFPVIRLECAGQPAARAWAIDRLWSGDAARMTDWASSYQE